MTTNLLPCGCTQQEQAILFKTKEEQAAIKQYLASLEKPQKYTNCQDG